MIGKDRGRDGKIERVYTKQNRVMISGINVYKKHIKKSEQFPKGGVAELPRPISAANVALICSKCEKPTRIGFEIAKNKKYRICKKCDSRV